MVELEATPGGRQAAVEDAPVGEADLLAVPGRRGPGAVGEDVAGGVAARDLQDAERAGDGDAAAVEPEDLAGDVFALLAVERAVALAAGGREAGHEVEGGDLADVELALAEEREADGELASRQAEGVNDPGLAGLQPHDVAGAQGVAPRVADRYEQGLPGDRLAVDLDAAVAECHGALEAGVEGVDEAGEGEGGGEQAQARGRHRALAASHRCLSSLAARHPRSARGL